jgi:hypothetical protein
VFAGASDITIFLFSKIVENVESIFEILLSIIDKYSISNKKTEIISVYNLILFLLVYLFRVWVDLL